MRKIILIVGIVALGVWGYYAFYTPGVEVDKVEEGAEIHPAAEALVGRWMSTEDSLYIMELNADGSNNELYDDELVSAGVWEVLETLENEGLDIEPDFEDPIYLKKVDENGEWYHYHISEYGEDKLSITYLFGNVLEFTRVQEGYSLEEVAAHNSPDDCWTAINGSVYDVTVAVLSHPGGDTILEGCGIDGTELYETRPLGSGTPHSDKADTFLETLYIGTLE